jgi:hypothetical protein
MPRDRVNHFLRYAIAVLSVGCATAIRLGLDPVLKERFPLVPCQPGIDMFLGLLSNPVGFHQDYGTESDHEQEVHRAVIG